MKNEENFRLLISDFESGAQGTARPVAWLARTYCGALPSRRYGRSSTSYPTSNFAKASASASYGGQVSATGAEIVPPKAAGHRRPTGETK